MQIVDEQIKQARLRGNLSVVQVTERATCSPLIVSRIKKYRQIWCMDCFLIRLHLSMAVLMSRRQYSLLYV